MIKYVSTKTARLYETAQGNARTMILIFGDEVEVAGPWPSARGFSWRSGRHGEVDAAADLFYGDCSDFP